MVTVDTIGRVRRAYWVQKKKIKVCIGAGDDPAVPAQHDHSRPALLTPELV